MPKSSHKRKGPSERPMSIRHCTLNAPQTDLVCPRDFLLSWDFEALEAVRMRPDPGDEEEQIDQISKRMGVDQETIKELSEVCSVDNLLCGKEPKAKKSLLHLKRAPNIDLKCVQHQMKLQKQREDSKVLRSACYRNMKYSHRDEHFFLKTGQRNVPSGSTNSDSVAVQQVPVPNVILSVQITKCRLSGRQEQMIPQSETFSVLGSQTLADLKDAIKCPVNSVIAGDYSSLPDVDSKSLPRAGDIYKSGLFFIENVFYNDMRQPDNKDYSKPIIEWAKDNWTQSQMTHGHLETKFFDLNIRLGHYYLYIHQGNCEHSIQFQELRLFTSEDFQDMKYYPLRTVERIKARKICQGCTKISAKWIIFDSPLVPAEPSFLCQLCLKALLYTPNGEKTSNFKAYHYTEYLAV